MNMAAASELHMASSYLPPKPFHEYVYEVEHVIVCIECGDEENLKILKCQHHVCKRCLGDLLIKACLEEKGLSCPVCKKDHPGLKKVDDFKTAPIEQRRLDDTFENPPEQVIVDQYDGVKATMQEFFAIQEQKLREIRDLEQRLGPENLLRNTKKQAMRYLGVIRRKIIEGRYSYSSARLTTFKEWLIGSVWQAIVSSVCNSAAQALEIVVQAINKIVISLQKRKLNIELEKLRRKVNDKAKGAGLIVSEAVGGGIMYLAQSKMAAEMINIAVGTTQVTATAVTGMFAVGGLVGVVLGGVVGVCLGRNLESVKSGAKYGGAFGALGGALAGAVGAATAASAAPLVIGATTATAVGVGLYGLWKMFW